MRLPPFFNFSEDKTDNGYETLQDFFLSWTIRCSQKEYEAISKKVYEYSRELVYILIYSCFSENGTIKYEFDIPDSFSILKVRTKRQYKRIDLIAELDIEINGESKTLILNIENKWYTQTSERQLQSAIQAIEGLNKNKTAECINLVIYCDNENLRIKPFQINLCKQNNYKHLTIEDLRKTLNSRGIVKTDNYLFDEYWSFR